VDNIPLLNDERPAAVIATGADMDGGARDVARERKAGSGESLL
jgi:hypothetical protein